MTYQNENDLVKACISKNRVAQYEVYQKYADAMYNTCCRMIQKYDEAEEVLQDAFVTVYDKIETFSFQSTLGAWIKRIVINKCIDHLRVKKQNWLELNEQIRSIPETNDTVVEVDIKLIKNAIMSLPDGYRTIFTLYTIEGYDHEEIGQILNISEQTSKSQYHRAKDKIKKILTANGDINKIYN